MSERDGRCKRQSPTIHLRIVDFAELPDFINVPVKRYSSGMYVRLSFAVGVHCDPDILLVDEALAVGDAHFREKCLARMAEIQRSGVTILFISHDLDMIESFCTRALLLDHGRLVADGAPAATVAEYSRLT